MKQLAVAVAVATLGTAAYAQSSVTLYGLVDTGIRVDRTNAGTGVSVGGGMGSGSRWGIRGSEDLGGGLSAIFTLEGGYGADTGASGQGGLLFGRQAFVGLRGSYGTLTFGRQYTPFFWATLAVDPVEYGTVANINNIYTRVVLRTNNSAVYQTPKLAGFEARLLYAPGETTAPGVARTAGGQLGGSLTFSSGGLMINYAYQEVKGAQNVANTPKEKHNQIGLTYKLFGDTKLSASYATFENDAAVNAVDFKNYWVALDGRITQSSTWMATYGRINDDSAANRDGSLLGLCLMYHLSRRTDLHFAVARMDNGSNAQYLITDSTNTGLQTTGLQSVATVPPGYSPTALGIGIRHRF